MKTIIQNILALLLIVAVCAGLVWVVPTKIMLCALFVIQVLILIIIGATIKSNDYGKNK